MEVAAQLLASGKLKASAATLERHLNEEKDKEVIKYGINTVETEAALRKGVPRRVAMRSGKPLPPPTTPCHPRVSGCWVSAAAAKVIASNYEARHVNVGYGIGLHTVAEEARMGVGAMPAIARKQAQAIKQTLDI
eukprot:XP_001694564.1 predicted protein [Chlamydomonas reinhardtii]